MCRLAVLVLLLCASLAASAHAQKIKIDIQSKWEGLGPTRTAHITISGSNDVYKSGAHTIDSKTVDAFLTALHEAPAPKITAADCGITEMWLADNAATSLQYFSERREQKPSAAQSAFFLDHFRSFAEVQAALDDRVKWVHLDDEPSIRVTVTSGSSVTVIASGAEYHFLAPWKDAQGNNPNFSCRISTTLGALLPAKLLNRGRLLLDDPEFVSELGEAIVFMNQEEWDRLGATSPVQPSPTPASAHR